LAAVAIISVFAAPVTHAQTGIGWNLRSAATTYGQGETIYFCLYDNAKVPFFFGPDEHPWKITNDQGKIIYEPASIAPAVRPSMPSFSPFCDSWNQNNSKGKQVRPGTYSLSFAGTAIPVEPLNLRIIKSKKQLAGNGK
jgi:hypothetical protein